MYDSQPLSVVEMANTNTIFLETTPTSTSSRATSEHFPIPKQDIRTASMHQTDSSLYRNPAGNSLRRFSFRRKPTRDSISTHISTWNFSDENHEWQLLRGNHAFLYDPSIKYITFNISIIT
ncbi:unnamed protein product [Rotaria socialis]|uniref:Uncharacterized protein n=1 Tax=Rotaria socialis TaxID=392032 RepID=A0A821CKD2_9BILA|nr:unnamed protein product [Rotaria socialis]